MVDFATLDVNAKRAKAAYAPPAKIRAACEARRSADFVVIGRTGISR